MESTLDTAICLSWVSHMRAVEQLAAMTLMCHLVAGN
jgi:hypothetical protein